MKALLILLVLSAPAHGGQFVSLISAAAAATIKPNPAPQPQPAPNDICDNCGGTGKLGDGTVSVTCPVCDGTGKKTTSPPPPAAQHIPAAVPPNFAHANLQWDAQHGRYLSADGKYAAEPQGAWQPRQWREVPQYRNERRVVGKQCNNGVCTPVYGEVRVRLPNRRVEVFSEPTDSDLPPDQQPAPMEGVGAGLRALNPRGKVIVDYGCGHDARWLIAAVRDFGAARGVGVEIDPEAAESARRYVAQAGLSDRIEIRVGDATTTSVKADVGVAYLFEDTLRKLAPKIRQLDRFVSYAHKVPGLPMREQGDVFVYERPQPMYQPVAVRPAGAVWGGRVYSGPVCNRRNCTMCNSIRNQLAVR